MRLKTLMLAAACGAMGLSACTTTSKALGITKNAPNEFNILTKAPLVVPPEYNLRPPQVGTSSADNNYSQKSAREALLGDIDEAEPTRGEVVLMSKAGVGRANQEIRLEIDGVNSVERKSKSFSDQVLFWKDGKVVTPNGAPMDPEIEARRMESMQAATGGGEVEITKRPSGPKLPGL
ncbi:DUF3035 domain-containing protein [Hellea balneolensis]|uniref:DUF3035 domain-containing protein n=1 Tax=Hellea balneolensis TaxID=287478 RepID=UPI0004792078|nr:DUF3035 domain-containing protein [Hellea balneolensis]